MLSPKNALPMVLVVDDHPLIGRALSRLLRSKGCESVSVTSGEAAMEYIHSSQVDLMVLDVMMPVMSGLDVLRALNAEGAVPRLPVVMFSASPASKDDAMSLGAVGFLLKGDVQSITDLVTRYVPFIRQCQGD